VQSSQMTLTGGALGGSLVVSVWSATTATLTVSTASSGFALSFTVSSSGTCVFSTTSGRLVFLGEGEGR
jgi:hypothetical protein